MANNQEKSTVKDTGERMVQKYHGKAGPDPWFPQRPRTEYIRTDRHYNMSITLSKFGRRSRRTLRITAVWMLLGVFTSLFESNVISGIGISTAPWSLLSEHLTRALIGGLLIGGGYMFLLHDRLRNLPFMLGALLVIGLLLLGTLVLNILVPSPWLTILPYSIGFWHVVGQFLYWALLMCGTMVMLRLSDLYGSGTLGDLLDHYRKPRQELRIFMFLDMRSSTSVAETIGDTRYFKLLNDLYADITDPVIYSEGEIYQYVGDEISVSWRLNRGIRNDRCIKCFFAIRGKLQKRAEYYRESYGIEPVFKAGFHFGRVTSGEVGIVKRQTIFSGDVVNTGAHIQASCNVLGVDNLVSKELLDVLSLRSLVYDVKPMGTIPLKGKRVAVELYTLSLAAELQ